MRLGKALAAATNCAHYPCHMTTARAADLAEWHHCVKVALDFVTNRSSLETQTQTRSEITAYFLPQFHQKSHNCPMCVLYRKKQKEIL